jgi:hypothetical protein
VKTAPGEVGSRVVEALTSAGLCFIFLPALLATMFVWLFTVTLTFPIRRRT